MGANSQIDVVEPHPKPAAGRNAPAANPWWLLATIALVAWSSLCFPKSTLNAELDPSWQGVLAYAHEKGLHFGHDIVFTYGPLGVFSISCFTPQIAVARIFFEVALGCGIATGLCLLAWQIALPWRLVLLSFFIFISMPLHWGGDALLIDLGIFSWGLLCFLESGRRLHVFAPPLMAFIVVGALVKFTFLMIGMFTIVLLACDLVLRRRRALAAGMLVGIALLFLLSWVLLGQNLSGLGTFLSTSYAIADGYNASMAMNMLSPKLVLVMLAAAVAAVAIRTACIPLDGLGFHAARRGLLFAWLMGVLFLNWKYVCVRSDVFHMEMVFGLMPIVAICINALPTSKRQAVYWSGASTLLCLFAGVILVRTQIDKDFFPLKFMKQTCGNMSDSLCVLLKPSNYLSEKTEALRAEQKAEQLPKIRAAVGKATADVFGQSQTYALANELNYTPRPIFQNYSAYTRRLMELNEQFYQSEAAPEYVLFDLQPIDWRFPPLEDAYVLRQILINYKPLFSEGNFLLFHRKRTAKAQMTMIKEETVGSGEDMDLRDQHGTNLWLEIDLQPTIAGRLLQFLYKPRRVGLTVTRSSGTTGGTAPAAMLSAGFLASPVILDDGDIMKFCIDGKASPPDKYLVEMARSPIKLWQPKIHYRLYRIDNIPSAHSL